MVDLVHSNMSQDSGAGDFSSANILVVDDDPNICKVLAMRLRSEGYIVSTANTVDAALGILGMSEPTTNGVYSDIDLVLVDVFMPDKPGIELCRQLKNDFRTQDIPVIVITGSSDHHHLEDAFNAGAMDFIPKPFRKIELLARIRSALKLKKEINERLKRERDLTDKAHELYQANIKLEQLTIVDSLTGVNNRRYFDQRIESEFTRAIRGERPLSLLMLDIDAFKAFNDLLGHPAGDQCLKAIAGKLANMINRAHDVIARYGGEEFAVILPETGLQGALYIAEQLRQAVLELNISHPVASGHDADGIVTISVGVTEINHESDRNSLAMIGRADEALYRSKHDGRNRVSCVS